METITQKQPFWFLSTPYRKYPHGLHAAFTLACENTALLIKAKVPVFSPIAIGHFVALIGDIDPVDNSIWLAFCQPFMEVSYGIIRLQAEGWEESDGMRHEENWFIANDRPIVAMTPGVVPEKLVG